MRRVGDRWRVADILHWETDDPAATSYIKGGQTRAGHSVLRDGNADEKKLYPAGHFSLEILWRNAVGWSSRKRIWRQRYTHFDLLESPSCRFTTMEMLNFNTSRGFDLILRADKSSFQLNVITTEYSVFDAMALWTTYISLAPIQVFRRVLPINYALFPWHFPWVMTIV